MMKTVFYFMLKALFTLRSLHFCPDFFGYVEKGLDEKANFKIYYITDWTTKNCNTHIPNISSSAGNQATFLVNKFGH